MSYISPLHQVFSEYIDYFPRKQKYHLNDSITWVCENRHEVIKKLRNQIKSRKVCSICDSIEYTHPHLVSEFHPFNIKEAKELSKGSDVKVAWFCEKNHVYESTIANRVAGKSCPYCSSQKTLSGYNDMATVRPDIIHLFDEVENEFSPKEISPYVNKKIHWKCSENHKWIQVPSAITPTSCPVCNGKKVLPGFNDLKTLFPKIAKEMVSTKTINAKNFLAFSNKSVQWKCEFCSYFWEARVSSRTEQKTGCPVCAGKAVMKGFNDLESLFPEIAKELDCSSNFRADEITAKTGKIGIWKCSKCDSNWKALVKNRVNGYGNCPLCYGKSKPQKELFLFIQEIILENEIQYNTRDVIKPYELDIYIPELSIAFEFNGKYWHSDKYIEKTKGMKAIEYHNMKTVMCKRIGIELIHIGETEWKEDNLDIKTRVRKTLELKML